MTPTHPRAAAGWHQPPPERTPRLRLKPRAFPTGCVDGAWWPRSNDLAAELCDLLAVLSVRLGRINYVTYRLDEWAPAPATLPIGGSAVNLTGYRRQPRHSIEILGDGGTSVVLLVVPVDADPDQAHGTMMAAAAPDNKSTIEGLLVVDRH